MTTEFTFLRARAGWKSSAIAIIGVPDDYIEFSTASYFFRFVSDDPPGDQWGQDRISIGMWIVGVSSYVVPSSGARRFCAISAEGDVAILDDPGIVEKIPGAGIASDDSKYYGRMENICGVGAGLFACGDGGQIYQRRASGEWICLAPELLQPPGVPAAECDMFSAIAGPSETDVYVVGRFGKILHWDGSSVRQLASPTRSGLVKICVESEERIWICGAGSTLLVGNRKDGFTLAPGISGAHHFNSMTMYGGKPYLVSSLGSTRGLYTYEDGRLLKVATGLTPELEDVKHTDAGAGVLWAVGLKDVVRFDGKSWERIDFPFNPPIR